MFIGKRDKRTKLEKEIDSVIEMLATVDPESSEYTKIVNNLETLYRAKGYKTPNKISWDTVVIVGGQLLGIGLILGHERLHVITTKALGFVIRGRV